MSNLLTNLTPAGTAVLDPANGITYATPADLALKFSKDVRTGLPGGVRCAGGYLMGNYYYETTSHGIQVVFKVLTLPVSGYGYVLSGSVGPLGHFGVAVFPDGSCQIYNGSNSIAMVSWPAGSIVVGAVNNLNWNHADGSTAHAGVLNRVVGTQSFILGQFAFAFYWLGAHAYGGADRFLNCEVILWRLSNFAMTDDEQLGASREESRGRLAYEGFVATPTSYATTSAPGGWYAGFDGSTPATLVNNTTYITCSNFATGGVMFGFGTLPVLPGQSIRVKGTVSVECAVQLRVPAPVYDAGAYTIIPAGDFDVTLTNTSPASAYAFVFKSGGASTDVAVTSAVALGTVESYESRNVRKGGGWRGVRGKHLIPVGAVLALDGEPAQTRTARYYVDYSGSGTATALNDECALSFTFPDTSTARITWPTWFTPAMKASTSIKGSSAVLSQGALQLDATIDTGGAYCTVAASAAAKKAFIEFSYTE